MTRSIRRTVDLLNILFVALIPSACSMSFTQTADGESEESREVNIPVVEAVQSRLGALPLSERLNGTVISQNQVVLYPETSGRIVKVLVKNGAFVHAGDLLAILDGSQFREQMRQAEANLRVNQASLSQAKARHRELEVQYRRTAELAEEGLSSQMEVETLQAQLESARANIELVEAQIQESESAIEETKTVLSKTEVRAPITGTIGRRNAEVGMQVGPDTELFTIGDLNQLRVEVVLTAEALNHVEVGQSVKIFAGAGRRSFNARLSRISPFLDRVTRSTEAEIDIADAGDFLRPGMSVTVDILFGESREATLIPSSALYSHPNTGEEGVYLLPTFDPTPGLLQQETDGSPAVSSAVRTEFRVIEVVAEGRMEIGVDGLDPETWVVTVGQNLLAEGREQARVRPIPWERAVKLQSLQREDLLNEVLASE